MNLSLTRRLALGLLAGAALVASPALAQDFPTRVIKMVVPYPAGGPTDVIARIVAEEMGKDLGQNVIVENLAGASGAVGTRAVARAEPDGYTIVFGNNQTHGNNMFLLKDPGYDAVKDFAPLAGAGAFEHVFVVSNDLPVKTIPELIALAKKEPGKLNYGSTGVGSGSHLATELFMTRTGIKMTHVPFRGAAPLVTELMAGRIDVSNSTLPSVLAQFQAGQMRAIGIASPKRNPQAPDVPTLREQGVTDADAESWAAFFAPAKTPQPVLDKLSKTIIAILNKPDVKERITKLGFTLNVRDPEAFKPYLAKEIQTWADVIKAANIKTVEGN
ncbi:Bug family tripartite tricarboxylate transporter substrate binding protein [Microvirga thermotolerans]|uniref:Tripartite tricarboxylate transporter substrate binding protein n=1 Tax=Microvirga thermotolerans TaxID=2651334 RepID=A0A5P9K018_9HYPH|nr:tripartite tricarboxylate transporter substrate binding protein [Microvirga thermotolerans]QFU17236.1 tripartite tricarboxylate transporter substrate binding protein [Microvirga thermotolerans]